MKNRLPRNYYGGLWNGCTVLVFWWTAVGVVGGFAVIRLLQRLF